MKKTFFLALVIATTLGACGGKKKHAADPAKPGSAMHDGSAAGGDHGSGDHGSAAPTP
jgi:hypothetical protein